MPDEARREVARIKKLLACGEWNIPERVQEELPAHIFLMSRNLKLENNQVVAANYTPRVQLQAARVLAMMNRQNMDVLLKQLPDVVEIVDGRPALKPDEQRAAITAAIAVEERRRGIGQGPGPAGNGDGADEPIGLYGPPDTPGTDGEAES